jgi:hypothetical protein
MAYRQAVAKTIAIQKQYPFKNNPFLGYFLLFPAKSSNHPGPIVCQY